MKKITIIKKAVVNAKPHGICPVYIDDLPITSDKR
jgi:hypothetical protein